MLILLAIFFSVPVHAAVTVTFYSREMGTRLPHAFITLHGTLDADGTPVDTSYGFTAIALSPAILFGSVPGEVRSLKPDYIAESDPHGSVVISDEEYARLMAVVEKWRTKPGKSYNLNRENCVHFVAEIGRSIGMDAPDVPKLMKRPRSFIVGMIDRNQAWIAARTASPGMIAAH
ncbi:hypothetical protein ACFB49_02000 [Sphingomonas sp. DBB INV C78]|uniref:hypothetical protein n=1 Tax=Sphingomonas sp. DBB INV C78 TaxID=3349434 RepID=UPI0036D31D8A